MHFGSFPLSVALRESTAVAHEKAEQSTFMAALIKGERDIHSFTLLQEQAWHFYSAMEKAGHVLAEKMGGIYDPEINRAQALENDLRELGGRINAPMLEATKKYVDRLEEIHNTAQAHLLIAHHYVRYMGDLSGGQAIGRMMRRHYGVPAQACSFYNFSVRIKPYKDSYRDKLDALVLEDSQRVELLNEAEQAFNYNLGVFQNLSLAAEAQ